MRIFDKAMARLLPRKPATDIQLVASPAPGYPAGRAFHVYPAGNKPEKPIVVMVSPRGMAFQ